MLLATATAATAKSLQSCPTLCDPIDSSPPGSPVPGILQARTLEWVAISCFLVCVIKICGSYAALWENKELTDIPSFHGVAKPGKHKFRLLTVVLRRQLS